MTTSKGLHGWMPIAVHPRPSGLMVDWCYTDGVPFDDPFFEQTIERCLREPFRLLFRRETPLDAMTSRGDKRPDGFIFHMSRCGSTLVGRMLRAAGSTLVVSEAGPIDTVLRAEPGAPRSLRVDRLRAIVTALGQPRRPEHGAYVVKFDAWGALDLDLIREAFPDVPWVFLYREPEEVIASQLRRPGYHLIPGALQIDGLDPSDASGMTREAYCAAVLERICGAVLRHRDDPQGRFVAYGELPRAVPDVIAGHFGIACGPAERAAMLEVARWDAKSPSLPFEPLPGILGDAELVAAAGRLRSAYHALEAMSERVA